MARHVNLRATACAGALVVSAVATPGKWAGPDERRKALFCLPKALWRSTDDGAVDERPSGDAGVIEVSSILLLRSLAGMAMVA